MSIIAISWYQEAAQIEKELALISAEILSGSPAENDVRRSKALQERLESLKVKIRIRDFIVVAFAITVLTALVAGFIR